MAGLGELIRCPRRRCPIALAITVLDGCGVVSSSPQSLLVPGHLIPTNKPRSIPVSRTLILVADESRASADAVSSDLSVTSFLLVLTF
jgi:hypothetical protein